VFEEAHTSPVSDGSDRTATAARGRAAAERGCWEVKDGKRVNAKGEVLDIEFLIAEPTIERILAGFVKNLQAIGVQTTIRRIDPAQVRAPRQVVRLRTWSPPATFCG
jgi:microcin C transport system substrate-binding protein